MGLYDNNWFKSWWFKSYWFKSRWYTPEEELIAVCLIQQARKILVQDVNINSYVSEDKLGDSNIRPEITIKSYLSYPMITLKVEELESYYPIPSAKDLLNITIHINKDIKPCYDNLRRFSDIILALFNREGGVYNELTTGLRICNILKLDRSIEFDADLNLYYCEMLFEVVRSEEESFAGTVAGDKPWE
jgi:hypothetical protein